MMLAPEAKQALLDCTPAYVATVCPDGTPNLSPRGTAMAWDDDRIVFLDLRSPQTTANLRASPHVELNVVDPFTRKGYRFKGVAQVLVEGPLYEEIVAHYERERALKRERVRAVVVVEVRDVRRLLSPAYDQGATEAELRATWAARYRELVERSGFSRTAQRRQRRRGE